MLLPSFFSSPPFTIIISFFFPLSDSLASWVFYLFSLPPRVLHLPQVWPGCCLGLLHSDIWDFPVLLYLVSSTASWISPLLWMSQLFPSGGQSTGVSASTSVCPINIQDWSPLELTGLISLQSKGLLRVFQNHSSKTSIFQCTAFFMVQLSHPYMTTGKTTGLTNMDFCQKSDIFVL